MDNQNKWKALKNYKPNDGASLLGTEKSIEPIVKCTWYQHEPYNNDCPKIGEETTLTGCVATAIGQILKTYEFPKQGYGSHTYTHPTIGELSTTMTKYNWNNIKESYTGDPGEAGAEDVAALLYQIGVALEMNYGLVESSSSTMVATVVLQDYFQCKTNTIHYEFREDFDYEAYKSQILADLKAGRPMLYGGVKSSTGGGHQFILDGYEYDEVTGDMFHINYGWGGSSNGNYTLDELIYDTEQDVVFGIEPDKSLWVNKHRFDMPSAGGDITLAVRSQYDYNGTASISTNVDWLTLSTTTAVGDGEFTDVVVTATANTTGRERSAVITVVQNGETETVTINQLPGSGIAGWYGELTSLESPSKGKLIEGKEIILLPERYGSFAAGQQLLAVSFVTKEDNTYNNKDFTIKIYEDSKTDWRLDNSEYTKNVDGCLGTLVYSQDYTATEFGTQEVKLDEPYVISGKNFWIGLELKGNTSIAYNDNTLIENVCAGPNYFDLSRKRIYEKNASGTQINTNIYNWKTSTDDDGTIYYEKYNKDWVIGFYVTDGVNNEMPIALADNANIQAILLNNFVDELLAPSRTELSANEDLILYPQVRNIGPLDITEAKKVQSIITAGDKVINTYINPWDWVAEDTWYKWFLTNADRTFIITADMFNENLLSGTFDVCFNVDYIDQPDVLAADNTYCITVTREVPEFTVEVVSANDKQGSARALTDNATYTLGSSFTAIATPETGYKFVKWTIDGEEASTDAEYTFTVTRNVNIQAIFEPLQYTVNVVVGENGTVTGDGIYNFGENATVTVTANEGYKFVGFENIDATEPTLTFTVTNDTTFTAIFKKILNVTASANVENAGTVTVSPEGEILEGDEVTAKATVNKGYNFVNWTVGDNELSDNTEYTFNVTDNIALVANFEPIQYTVNVVVGENGTVTGDGIHNFGENATVTVTANEGYKFVGFENIDATEPTLTFIVTNDTTFTAVFKKILNVTASANVENAGIVTVSPEGEILEGDEITLTANANEGFVFNYWESNDEILSNNATYTFVASTSATYIAVFDEKLPDSFDVSASTNNSTFGTVSGAGQYDLNDDVELVATANEGYKFVNWTNADGEEVSTEATYSFAATADVVLTANFEAIQCVVTLTFEGEGTVTGDGTYNYGDEVTITATPAEHNELKFWLDQGGDMVSTDLSFTITVTSDTTIHAVFVSTLCQIDTYTEFGGTTSGDGAVYKGDEITITAIPAEGFEFKQWEDEIGIIVSYDAVYTFEASFSMIYTAVFEKVNQQAQYTVTLTFEGEGTVAGAGTYNYGDEVTITATPAEHNELKFWLNGQEGDMVSTDLSFTITVTSDTTIHAVFVSTLCQIDTYTEFGGTTSGDGAVYKGDEITITAIPAEGFEFKQWEDEIGNIVSYDAVYTFEASYSMIYTAVFEKVNQQAQYTVTLTFEGEGTVEGAGTYNYGDEVTITATPAEHNELKFWLNGQEGDMVSTDLSFTITVTSDTTIHAVFVSTLCQIDTYTEFGGTTSGDGAVYKGDEITITAVADEGFEFKQWEDEIGNIVSYDAVYTFEASYSMIYTAVFASKVCEPTYGKIDTTACGSFTYNGKTYTESGEYQDKLQNHMGCDSIVTIILTILQPSENTIEETTCGSFTYNDVVYTESGTYYHTFTNAEGCDSIVTLNLVINKPTTNLITIVSDEDYVLNGTTYSETGIYKQTVTNTVGCDSIITLVYTRINEYGDIASANSVDSVDAETEIIIRPETFATFTEGQVLQSIKFSIGSSLNFDNKDFTIKIYENVSLNDSLATVDGQYELTEDFEEVYSQGYSAETYGSQTVTFDTPYKINGSTFWIAIACNDATAFSASHKILSDSVATADSLVSKCSKGFLILSDGVLSTNYGYTEFIDNVGDEEVTYYQVYDIEFAVSFSVADKTPEEPNTVAKVAEEKMIVYPNPVENGFYVANGKGKTIEIYTRNGSKVASVPLNGTTWVDASELKPGVYFVRVDKEIRQILKK